MPSTLCDKLRLSIRKAHEELSRRRLRVLDSEDLRRSALIVSPHPDDEVLGCGGTILRRKQLGARIAVVMMTDGSSSHRDLLPVAQMRAIRAREAENAAERMNIDNLEMLAFPDGELESHSKRAAKKLHDLVDRFRPQDVFVPCVEDRPPDHRTARQIALSVLQSANLPVRVYEYPVWAWHQWPWTSGPRRGDDESGMRFIARQVLYAARLSADLRWGVEVTSVLAEKRAALFAYQSQMTRPRDIRTWPTLDQVADGEFLARFFQPHELFRRYELRPL